MNLNDNWVYFNGSIIKEDEVRISPTDRGFMFGDGVYEVVRSYCGNLFYIQEHLRRLKESLDKIRVEYPQLDEIVTISRELLKKNNLEDSPASIYIQITRGKYYRMHQFPEEEIAPTVFINVSKFIPNKVEFENGIRVITLKDFRWSRCDIKTISLLPNVLARQQAIDEGAEEAVFVRDGNITEGTHTNFFGINDGVVITHPKSNFVLPGITRDIIIDTAKSMNLPVAEIAIPEVDISEYDEFFLTGTASEIIPVIQINDLIINNGKPGPVTRQIQNEFLKQLPK